MTDAPCGKMGPAAIILPRPQIERPRVERLMFLATGHLAWETIERIETGARINGGSKFGLCAIEYGFFGWVPEADDADPEDPFPEDLAACFAYARAQRCQWVRFDAEESLLDALPDHSATHP